MDKRDQLLKNGIYFLANVVMAVIVSEFLENLSTSFEQLAFVFLAICLVLLTFLVARTGSGVIESVGSSMATVEGKIEEAIKAVGVRVRYIDDRWVQGQYREGKVFEEVSKIVNNAETEILISGYNDPKFDPALTNYNDGNLEDKSQKKRIAYLETIEKKLLTDNPKPIRYYRIIQMPNALTRRLSSITLGPVEFEHCRNVLEIRNKKLGAPIKIMKMETERISTFMIIDGKYLILSDLGTRKTDLGEGDYLVGVFIIEDLNGSIINWFKSYFLDELVFNASPIELKDLYFNIMEGTL